MIRGFAFCLSILLCASSAAQTPLRVKMFPGAQSLPVTAALSQGVFDRLGLKVEVLFTASSCPMGRRDRWPRAAVVRSAVQPRNPRIRRRRR